MALETGSGPEHIEYDLGKRKVKFYSLTKPDIEIIARDIEDAKTTSVWLGVSLTALVTLAIECMVNDFSSLPAPAQAVMYLGIPVSAVLTIIFGLAWFRGRKTVRAVIDERLAEVDQET